MSDHNPLNVMHTGGFSAPRTRASSRIAMLGAVALMTLGGIASNVALLTIPARAETALNQAMAPLAGPASFADLVDRVKGAVVSVRVKTMETAADDRSGEPQFRRGEPMERFFRQFGENGQRPKPQRGMSQGSGFIISADGYVVTNNHVVEHGTDVELVLDGGRVVAAKIVGVDSKTDLALLKIKEKGDYPFVQFGAKVPRIGDWVVAVGNPFGLGGTVTAGIVSARGRDIGSGPYDDFLQIDAPVNRGNSGGPTFDASGQVVGVNTAIFSPSGGSVGIGFAIPAETAKEVVAALKDKGMVARGYIGVQIQPITQDIADSLGLKSVKGALVAEAKSGPAADAGVKSGDVIVAVNGEQIEGPRELSRKIAGFGPGKTVMLTYLRAGVQKNADVKLGQLPAEREQRADLGKTDDSNALGRLGLAVMPAGDVPGAGTAGVVIADIDPDGQAAQKGMHVGDIILEAAGKPVQTSDDVKAALKDARKDGQKALLLRVKSGDASRYVAFTLKAAL